MQPEGTDGDDSWPPTIIKVLGGTEIKVYPVGAWAWIWDQVNEMKPNDIVKYSKPSRGEEDFRFILLQINPPLDGIPAKATIQLICDYSIKPIETVFLEEVCAAD